MTIKMVAKDEADGKAGKFVGTDPGLGNEAEHAGDVTATIDGKPGRGSSRNRDAAQGAHDVDDAARLRENEPGRDAVGRQSGKLGNGLPIRFQLRAVEIRSHLQGGRIVRGFVRLEVDDIRRHDAFTVGQPNNTVQAAVPNLLLHSHGKAAARARPGTSSLCSNTA